ncbi:hypothetical protein [Ectobacillus funiculus]|uniref:Uncharacterized protein n=1 Tax=Ectobacillus funiculus TaxID=137993 RepID=A0ABV5WA86_9BACI
MSNLENNEQAAPKKVSLQEAMKQMLANKKQGQATGKTDNGLVKNTKAMKSQQTKKPNNQRRRTGV